MKQSEVTLGRFLRIVLVFMTIALSYIVLDSLSSVLLPFAIAWLVAYFIHPLVNFVQYKMRLKYRIPSIIVALLMIIVVVTAVAMLIVPSMYSELYSLKHLTVSFLNENIKNSSIPARPLMIFFLMLSLYAAKLQNVFSVCIHTPFSLKAVLFFTRAELLK